MDDIVKRKRNEQSKKRRKENPEKWKAYQKKWRDKNKETISRKTKEQYHKNKGKVLTREEVYKVLWKAQDEARKKRGLEILDKGKKVCTKCGKEKELSEFYPDPRCIYSFLQSKCKKCSNKYTRDRNYKKRIKVLESHGGICKLCGVKIIDGVRYAIHHISYNPTKTVLLCHRCHNTLHSIRIYKLDFIKEHGSDLAPYEWAKKVINLYEDKGGGKCV